MLVTDIANSPISEEVLTLAVKVLVSPAFTTTAGEKVKLAVSSEDENDLTLEALQSLV
ncbi:MAG: hypothetical protein HON27_17355 [Candidatus Marinimicrobia bacterium]|nr:hypothetical protein [Candidatus Neomarinimicrobiota bacterium]